MSDKAPRHTLGRWIVNPRVHTHVTTTEGRGICSTAGYETNQIPAEVLDDENRANARLIAACPQMFSYINSKAAQGDEDAAQIIASIV